MKYTIMQAQIGNEEYLDNKHFIFEPKLDGIRVLCYVNSEISFITRTENNITQQFPEIILSSAVQVKSCVLDGEIVVLDKDGNPDFKLLQGRDQLASSLAIKMRSTQNPATFVIFDILEKNGKSLIEKPLSERKKILEDTVQNTQNVQIISYTKDGHSLWKEIKKRNIEGVIAKNIKSHYECGIRSANWLKIKTFTSLDCIIIGYRQEEEIITALALGVYKNGKLHYLGNVEMENEEILTYLQPILAKLSSTKTIIKSLGKDIIQVTPTLVCEVQYSEITKTKKLKGAVFMRLRNDVVPEECGLPN